jgi:hypothetical protein
MVGFLPFNGARSGFAFAFNDGVRSTPTHDGVTRIIANRVFELTRFDQLDAVKGER